METQIPIVPLTLASPFGLEREDTLRCTACSALYRIATLTATGASLRPGWSFATIEIRFNVQLSCCPACAPPCGEGATIMRLQRPLLVYDHKHDHNRVASEAPIDEQCVGCVALWVVWKDQRAREDADRQKLAALKAAVQFETFLEGCAKLTNEVRSRGLDPAIVGAVMIREVLDEIDSRLDNIDDRLIQIRDNIGDR